MKKIKLNFMVVPSQLSELAYVPEGALCKIIDVDSLWLEELLGQSGRRLAQAGANFYFTRKLANDLASKGVVEIIYEN